MPGDPSDPRVQEVFRRAIQELADNYADSPALMGISLLISRGLSNSYVGIRWGYGDATIRRFTEDTGITVPVDETAPDRFMERYRWLTANERERWAQWRNDRVAALDEDLRRIVVEKRPGLEFHLSYREPRDVDVYNWSAGETSFHGLLRDKGIDPLLARGKPGQFVDMPYQAGANWRFQGEAYFSPLVQALRWSWLSPEANRLFENGDQTGVWIYPECVERKGSFRDWWWGKKGYLDSLNGTEGVVAPPTVASGRCFLEPYARALIMQDAKVIYAGSWSHLYPGNENLLREFAVEYRSLPKRTFRSIGGHGDHSVVLRELTDGGRHYLYAVNASWYPATATVALSGPTEGLHLRRITTGEDVPLTRDEENGTARAAVTVQPFQLMTFLLEPADAMVETYEGRADMPRSDYDLPFTWGE